VREILFKAKQCGSGLWLFGNVAGYVINDDAEVCFLNETTDNGKIITRYCTPETVCQFTGLKDANGDRIFEGDILQMEGVATQYTVIFEKCGFEVKRRSVLFGMLAYEHSQYIVAGNIHDAAKEGGE